MEKSNLLNKLKIGKNLKKSSKKSQQMEIVDFISLIFRL